MIFYIFFREERRAGLLSTLEEDEYDVSRKPIDIAIVRLTNSCDGLTDDHLGYEDAINGNN